MLEPQKCIICDEIICKYKMDLAAAGAIFIKDEIICEDCAKEIAKQLIDNV